MEFQPITIDSLTPRSYDACNVVTLNGYIIPENAEGYDRITIELRRQMSGQPLWAIYKQGYCFSKSSKEFEYEPLPSSRDCDFIKDTRFKSIDLAIDALNEYRERKLAEALENKLTIWGK